VKVFVNYNICRVNLTHRHRVTLPSFLFHKNSTFVKIPINLKFQNICRGNLIKKVENRSNTQFLTRNVTGNLEPIKWYFVLLFWDWVCPATLKKFRNITMTKSETIQSYFTTVRNILSCYIIPSKVHNKANNRNK